MTFLYTNNELSGRNIMKATPFILHQNNKIPGNKMNQDSEKSVQ